MCELPIIERKETGLRPAEHLSVKEENLKITDPRRTDYNNSFQVRKILVKDVSSCIVYTVGLFGFFFFFTLSEGIIEMYAL